MNIAIVLTLGLGPRVRKQTLLVQDFAHEYLIAGHVIWHGHFLKFWSSSKVPLKVTRHLCFKNSKNLQLLDVRACNLANRAAFQNPTKKPFCRMVHRCKKAFCQILKRRFMS